MTSDCEQPTRPCPFNQEKFGRLLQLSQDIATDIAEIKRDVKKQNGRTDRIEKELEPLKQADLPKRMGSMERWRAKVAGIILAATVLIPLIYKALDKAWP